MKLSSMTKRGGDLSNSVFLASQGHPREMNSNEIPTRPAFRYHGGKWRIASWIISHFPRHKIYVEPYGGAASVLIRKPRSYGEIYNDLDGDVVNLFKVLRNPKQRAQLIELVRYTPYARDEFDIAFDPIDEPVERARRLLIRAEMGFGSAGASKGATGFRCASVRHLDRSNPSRSSQMLWAESLPDNLIRVASRLQGVTIENKPAVELIDYWDHQHTLFYIDPPYTPKVRELGNRQRAYRCEMTEADHVKLLNLLCQLEGMVIISGYFCETYNSILTNWSRLERQVAASGNRGSVTRNECLWMNPAAVDRINKSGQQSFDF